VSGLEGFSDYDDIVGRYLESNRKLWDEWTKVHVKSDFYDVEGFKAGLREGRHRLRDYELAEIGEVDGLEILHLQCHFGIDTLSFAHLGARVTGVDFSPAAIEAARQLSGEVGLEASFVCSDVYELAQHLDGTFDLVYTSRGVLGWLPDIRRWAEVVANFVKPGGRFYLNEIHPIAQVWDEDSPERFIPRFGYWSGDVISIPTEGSYADRTADVEASHEYGWNHSLGEIVTALVDTGLEIGSLHEYPWLEWPFPGLVEDETGRFVLPETFEGSLPFMFSLLATKDFD
jgi:SAM-dependent methyltransferase